MVTVKYLIRKSLKKIENIIDGRENVIMLTKNDCMKKDEVIHFVAVENGKRTGKGCWCRIENVYEGKLVKYRLTKTEGNNGTHKKKTR